MDHLPSNSLTAQWVARGGLNWFGVIVGTLFIAAATPDLAYASLASRMCAVVGSGMVFAIVRRKSAPTTWNVMGAVVGFVACTIVELTIGVHPRQSSHGLTLFDAVVFSLSVARIAAEASWMWCAIVGVTRLVTRPRGLSPHESEPTWRYVILVGLSVAMIFLIEYRSM